MKIFYLYAIPETLVSLVRTGQMPDNSLEKRIYLYPEPNRCVQSSLYIARSTFLIELSLPPDSNLDPVNFTFIYEDELPIKIQALKIETSWISRIYTSNQSGHNLAMRYFNMTENPVPICIKEEYFERVGDTTKTTYTVKESIPITPNIIFMKSGDLLGSQAQTLVNTVNCVGIMGKGIAKMFKDRFPHMFADYAVRCKAGEVALGKPYLFKGGRPWIVNFPTKNHWRNNSHLEDIEEGLKYLVEHLKEWGITSIAIPPLGCGNGGLDWEQVRPLILKYLSTTNVAVEVYAPFTPKKEPTTRKRKHESYSSSQAELTNFFSPSKDEITPTSNESSHHKQKLLKK